MPASPGFTAGPQPSATSSGDTPPAAMHPNRSPVLADARALVLTLPRAYEALVRGRVKFRVGRIVFLAFSRDGLDMGFAFPQEEREALVGSDPATFRMPATADLRYNWVVVRLDRIDLDELHELVVDAWRMVVPKKLWRLVGDIGP